MSIKTTAFELIIQIATENASIVTDKKKTFQQILKLLSAQTKQHRKALEALEDAQQKAWKLLFKEIEQQKQDILSEVNSKIPHFQTTLDFLSRNITQQAQKATERQPLQRVRRRTPRL